MPSGTRYNLVGKLFGNSIVLCKFGKTKNNDTIWSLKCKCGQTYQATTGHLNANRAKQCQICSAIIANSAGIKHGDSPRGKSSLTYSTWEGIIRRCNNKNSPHYERYGGRGIKVCKKWLKYENFKNDMGDRPSNKYSIERIDNNKGYNKGNCRWATRLEQMQNVHTNVRLLIKGEKISLHAAARKYNISPSTLIYRIRRQGKKPDEAIKK